MRYKADLGGKVMSRADFLRRWQAARERSGFGGLIDNSCLEGEEIRSLLVGARGGGVEAGVTGGGSPGGGTSSGSRSGGPRGGEGPQGGGKSPRRGLSAGDQVLRARGSEEDIPDREVQGGDAEDDMEVEEEGDPNRG